MLCKWKRIPHCSQFHPSRCSPLPPIFPNITRHSSQGNHLSLHIPTCTQLHAYLLAVELASKFCSFKETSYFHPWLSSILWKELRLFESTKGRNISSRVELRITRLGVLIAI